MIALRLRRRAFLFYFVIMAKRFGFGKQERLKSKKAIESLFTGGKSIPGFPIRLMYLIEPVPGESDALVQVGVTASKRHFKKAVDRNRIKRLLREAYRLQKHDLAETVRAKKLKIQLFLMFMDKTIPDYNTVKEAVSRSLAQLKKIAERNEDVA
jgi:ribonuclease P protein component